MYSIGDMSAHTTVKVTTIRYYEKIGLLSAPLRSAGNQRQYTQKELDRLLFIRHARELGFSIQDIKGLVDLSNSAERPCAEAHSITRQHLYSVKDKIRRLKRLERELKRIEGLADDGRARKCKIIEALSDHSLCETDH